MAAVVAPGVDLLLALNLGGSVGWSSTLVVCLLPVSALRERPVRTVEGLVGAAGQPGPLQQAFIAQQAAQCGYCIAGMIMRAQALLERVATPSDAQIREHMQTNLCRCGTHMRIVAAIREASRAGAGAFAQPEPKP